MTGRWQTRLFRLKDRRLMYFKKDVIDFNLAIDDSAKYVLDLTYLISLTISKKQENVLIIKHPLLDVALRFNSTDLFISWLKVLSVFTFDASRSRSNAPKIETALPSNYLYSIWTILQSLYTHPKLTKMVGIFRISANKRERKVIFNQLLQHRYAVEKLSCSTDIHILANILSTLLTNLPSTIFKEKHIENLMSFYYMISKRTQRNQNEVNNELFRFNPKQQHTKETNGSNSKQKRKAKQKHVDHDVTVVSFDILHRLKKKIEELYLNKGERHRYGLMTLVFHLLKQIVINQEYTKMSADSLSRIFVTMFESRIFLIRLSDPMQMFRMHYLFKTLIYHAYFIFPRQEWTVKDIVLAQKCECAMINRYYQYSKSRKKKKKRKQLRYETNTTKFESHFQSPRAQESENDYNHNQNHISKPRHKRYQLSKVFSDGGFEVKKSENNGKKHRRYQPSKIFSDGDIFSDDDDDNSSDSIQSNSTINTIKSVQSIQSANNTKLRDVKSADTERIRNRRKTKRKNTLKKHYRIKSAELVLFAAAGNKRRKRLTTIEDEDEAEYDDDDDDNKNDNDNEMDEVKSNINGIYIGRGRSDGVSAMIAKQKQLQHDNKQNKNNKEHKSLNDVYTYKKREEPQVVHDKEDVLFNMIVGDGVNELHDDAIAISLLDLRKDTIITSPKAKDIQIMHAHHGHDANKNKNNCNNVKLYMNNTKYNNNSQYIRDRVNHLKNNTVNTGIMNKLKEGNKMCVRCTYSGCKCATYIYVESSFGKCKYCNHTKLFHTDGFNKNLFAV